MPSHRFYLLRLIGIPIFILLGSIFLIVQVLAILNGSPAPTTLIARGHYTNGFERSYFEPCNSTAIWAIREGNLAPIEVFKSSLPQRAYPGQLETVYVAWRGVLTYRGPLGLFGGVFKVQEILDVHVVSPTDCQ